MPAKPYSPGRLTVAAAVTMVLLASCAATGSRGSLSDAATKARDDYDGERRVGDTQDDDDEDSGSSCLLALFHAGYDEDEDEYDTEWSDAGVTADISDAPYSEPVPVTPSPWKPIFAFKPLVGTGFSDLYRHATGAAVLVGGHDDRARIFIEVGYQAASTYGESPFDSSFANDYVGLFHAGSGYRYYFTEDHTFMGLFIEGACALSHAGWTYRNPLLTTIVNEYGDSTGTEMIESDGLWSIAPEFAAGFSPVQTDAFCLSLIARAGARLYMPESDEGFTNDMISGDAYVRLEAELAIGARQ